MGTITRTGSISAHPTSYDSTNYSYASVSSSYPLTNGQTDSNSTTYAQVNWKTGQNAETYVYYIFDFSSIPVGATINSVTAKAKGYVNTTNSSRVTSRQMQLFSGTTAKGSALTISTSTSEQTFSNVGSWTRADLQNARIRYYVKRGTSNTSSNYTLRMYGATMTVNYSWQETTYDITVSNSTSATVTANPTEVEAGGSSEIRADSVSGLTIKDNGTDVTSQFTQRSNPGYEISYTNRGSYGFALSNGYYVSQNKGVDKTCAVCRVNLYLEDAATVTFQYINYAEAQYDFGVFGNIDVALTTDYYPAGSGGATISETSYKKACNASSDNTSSVQTLTYSVSAGEHFIDVKYSKDDASSANNDTLQFKVTVTMGSGWPKTYYGYTISNVQANHTILVTSSAATDTIYFKNNGAWVAATKVYKKVNGSWVQQTDLTNVFDSSTNYVKGN